MLIAIIAILFLMNLEKAKPLEIKEPDNILFEKSAYPVFNRSINILYLDSLTLRQKIAQMIITSDRIDDKEALANLLIGGVYIDTKATKQEYIDSINNIQDNAIIPFFITTDMEGCINPFSSFQDFPAFKDIKTAKEAFSAGYEEGRLLKELGFSINFAPVVDLEDTIWKCRSFSGTPQEISEKAIAYINGLQENGIIATAKHYPGKTLDVNDPHSHLVYASLDRNDLLPFESSIKDNVSAIMISHIIVNGSADSESRPSVVSKNLVIDLKNRFSGLIITDDINMHGLTNFYSNKEQMYIDLFKAGNDIILYLNTNIKNVEYLISVVENAVKNGEISEEKIDDSVARILGAKGILVIR